MTLEWWRRRSEDGDCIWASYAQEEWNSRTPRCCEKFPHGAYQQLTKMLKTVYIGLPVSRQFVLNLWLWGGCPVMMALTSAMEFGSGEPESVRKNSSAFKSQTAWIP